MILWVLYFFLGQDLSIRAIDIIDSQTYVFAANNGVVGYTNDDGRTWKLDTICKDGYCPQFRSIKALNDSVFLIMSIDSPAYIFKTSNRGKSWKIVYENHEKGIFFDALNARSESELWAVGDPINDYPCIIYSNNAGDTWNKIANDKLPKLEKAEAFFAASNSNISFHKNNMYLVTGGYRSRLIIYDLKNFRFKEQDLPFIAKENMTGAYSIDVWGENHIVVSGGHYDKSDMQYVPFYYTNDGGKNWLTFPSKKIFFGSCVKYWDKYNFYITGHRGTYIINTRNYSINEVRDHNSNTLEFHTLRIFKKEKMILAGAKGRIASIEMKK